MINNKKIEDAAKQHSEESYISGYFQACYKDAFIEGAKWMQEEFLKDLWHPANEIPKIGRVIIMENYYPDGRIEFLSNWRKSTSHNPIEEKKKKWLYVDGLLLNRKEAISND